MLHDPSILIQKTKQKNNTYIYIYIYICKDSNPSSTAMWFLVIHKQMTLMNHDQSCQMHIQIIHMSQFIFIVMA